MKRNEKADYEKIKLTRWYELLNAWLCVKNNYAANFEDYFNDHDFRNIAIYGCGELGCRLFEELQHTDIKVFIYDRPKMQRISNISVKLFLSMNLRKIRK